MADDRVCGNLQEFLVRQLARLAQHVLAHADLADVVHHAAEPRALGVGRTEAGVDGKQVRKLRHARGVAARIRILGIDGGDERLHGAVEHGAVLGLEARRGAQTLDVGERQRGHRRHRANQRGHRFERRAECAAIGQVEQSVEARSELHRNADHARDAQVGEGAVRIHHAAGIAHDDGAEARAGKHAATETRCGRGGTAPGNHVELPVCGQLRPDERHVGEAAGARNGVHGGIGHRALVMRCVDGGAGGDHGVEVRRLERSRLHRLDAFALRCVDARNDGGSVCGHATQVIELERPDRDTVAGLEHQRAMCLQRNVVDARAACAAAVGDAP